MQLYNYNSQFSWYFVKINHSLIGELCNLFCELFMVISNKLFKLKHFKPLFFQLHEALNYVKSLQISAWLYRVHFRVKFNAFCLSTSRCWQHFSHTYYIFLSPLNTCWAKIRIPSHICTYIDLYSNNSTLHMYTRMQCQLVAVDMMAR